MDLNHTLRFDAPPADVFAMLTDEAFLARKAEATYAKRHEASVERAGDTATISQLRVMATDELPDFVQKFVGDSLELKQTDVWEAAAADGSRSGSLAIRIPRAPVTFNGTTALVAVDTGTGRGTEYRIVGEVKASIPLVGGKIERAVADALSSAVRAEEKQGKLWLASRA